MTVKLDENIFEIKILGINFSSNYNFYQKKMMKILLKKKFLHFLSQAI